MSIKKFIEDADRDLVKADKILREGDWLLRWDPNSPNDQSGYSLFTPKDFDPENGGGPLGGLILAAVYFLLENGEMDLGEELVARANALSRELSEKSQDDGKMVNNNSNRRTLN